MTSPAAPKTPNQYLVWRSDGDGTVRLLDAAGVQAAYAWAHDDLCQLDFDQLAQVVVNGGGEGLRTNLCRVASKGVRSGAGGARYAVYVIHGFGTVRMLDEFSVRLPR